MRYQCNVCGKIYYSHHDAALCHPDVWSAVHYPLERVQRLQGEISAGNAHNHGWTGDGNHIARARLITQRTALTNRRR